eukprot:comp24002_c1_seq1/m.42744 comp24002_c1_seq1/g.42744  ORF comp24002_c1_seq1/g.42744 comp24002_c1_seq1/m.42744 type:complete len:111 (-) comp24002_c1_seq1:710-1042(-)
MAPTIRTTNVTALEYYASKNEQVRQGPWNRAESTVAEHLIDALAANGINLTTANLLSNYNALRDLAETKQIKLLALRPKQEKQVKGKLDLIMKDRQFRASIAQAVEMSLL